MIPTLPLLMHSLLVISSQQFSYLPMICRNICEGILHVDPYYSVGKVLQKPWVLFYHQKIFCQRCGMRLPAKSHHSITAKEGL
jgi:hypothetical protein